MKKALLITLLVLLCTSILVSCGEETTSPSNNTPTTTKPNENAVRYTITEDEWNKTLAMNNYTVTLEIPTQPEVTQIERVTKNAIQRDMGYCDFWLRLRLFLRGDRWRLGRRCLLGCIGCRMLSLWRL